MSHVPTQPVSCAGTQQEGLLARVAIGFTAWAEKWFPDAFVSRTRARSGRTPTGRRCSSPA
jgi:hypothetical protein